MKDAREGDIYTNRNIKTMCAMTTFVLCSPSVDDADDLLTHSLIHGGHCILQPPVLLSLSLSLSFPSH